MQPRIKDATAQKETSRSRPPGIVIIKEATAKAMLPMRTHDSAKLLWTQRPLSPPCAPLSPIHVHAAWHGPPFARAPRAAGHAAWSDRDAGLHAGGHAGLREDG